jgi:hypothetical protein
MGEEDGDCVSMPLSDCARINFGTGIFVDVRVKIVVRALFLEGGRIILIKLILIFF